MSQCQILLEDVVAIQIRPLDPGNHMLLQKVLINYGIDAFTGAKENERTFLAVAAYDPQDHLLQWSLRFGRDADVGVHVGYKEVHQVAAVAAVDSQDYSEDFFIGKNPDLMRMAGLQLVDELLAPLLPGFLGVQSQKWVRSGRWTTIWLSSPRSSFTRCLMVFGSIL